MQSTSHVIVRPQAVPHQNRLARGLTVLVLGLALVMGNTLQGQARGAPESFADLAENVSPAVVNITTSTTVAAPAEALPQVPPGSPFEDFFKEFMDRNGQGNGQGNGKPRRSQALGSGFVVSEDGYIVTNNHVIDGADQIEIEFFSGNRLEAKLIGKDPKTDLALLKVESDKPLPFVPFGNSDLMRNSGGPLFNMDGQVVGVNTAILSPTGGSIGIGFSMASNVVSKVVSQLKQFGETRRGWLGVRIQDVTPDVADAMGLASAKGALITDVPEGPAMDAGMKAGDVITSFAGADVNDTRELVRRVADAPVGEAVRVVVMRDGKTQTLSVTLGRRETAENTPVPAVAGSPETPQAPSMADILGMTVKAITAEDADKLGISLDYEGLVIGAVDETSEAFSKGLRPGDLITEAGQQKVASIQDLKDRIDEATAAGRKSLLLLIRRGGDPRFVALTVAN